MAYKVTFDNMPAMVATILETVSSGTSEETLLPELLQRIARIEKKIDHLQLLLTPDKPVMDMQAVCKILKLRPKAVSDLVNAGILQSRQQGGKTVFYEDGVIKHYAKQPSWQAAAATETAAPKSVASDPASFLPVDGDRQTLDIKGASVLLGRSLPTVYQQISSGDIPFHKKANRVYFFADELMEWLEMHPPRPRKAKRR